MVLLDLAPASQWRPYEESILEEARSTCRREAPLERSRRSRWLHLRALLAAQRGHDNVAAACLLAALTLNPSRRAWWIALGDVLHGCERLDESLAACLHALRLAPGDPDAYSTVARSLFARGRLREAAALYDLALALWTDTDKVAVLNRPGRARAHREVSEVLQAHDRADAAKEHALVAARLDPTNADACCRLGELALSSGDAEGAAAHFREGLKAAPHRADLYVGLARALVRQVASEQVPGDVPDLLDEALALLRTALTIDPRHVEALHTLASTFDHRADDRENDREDHPENDEEDDQETRACSAEAWLALGAALEHERRYDDAVVACGEAVARTPGSLRALAGHASALSAAGKPAAAYRQFAAALALAPDDWNLRSGWRRAGDQLRLDDRPWQQDEWFSSSQRLPQDLEHPRWTGSPLAGRTILVLTLNSFGDNIQFLRYLPYLRDLGARVVVECLPRLAPLVEQMPCVYRVVIRSAPLPQFDTYEVVTRLPLVFGTGPSTIPGTVPYLHVDAAHRDYWRARLAPDHRLAVGLSWGGNLNSPTSRERFLPLSALGALATSGVRFVSLQIGPQSAETLAPPPGLNVENLQDESCSLVDTAALLMNLDLVITVDTMVAHLAGALARPTWTLLHRTASWRWLLDEHRTPWYPTMRLFRQTNDGDWANVIARVRKALEQFVATASGDRATVLDARSRTAPEQSLAKARSQNRASSPPHHA